MIFNRRVKAKAPRLEADAATLDDVVQRISDDVDRLSRIVVDLRSHIDATNQRLGDDVDRLACSLTDLRGQLDTINQRLDQAMSRSRSDQLAIDVAKALELALIDLNVLRRDVDAIGNADA